MKIPGIPASGYATLAAREFSENFQDFVSAQRALGGRAASLGRLTGDGPEKPRPCPRSWEAVAELLYGKFTRKEQTSAPARVSDGKSRIEVRITRFLPGFQYEFTRKILSQEVLGGPRDS